MALLALLGSTSSHGGTVISASSNFNCAGVGVARLGDSHSCPIDGHGVTPLVSTPTQNLTNNGEVVATIGAVAGCGAVIETGSSLWSAS